MALMFVSVTALFCTPRLWKVVVIMVAIWILTRMVSAYDMPGLWQAIADVTCGAALIAIRRPTIVVLPVAFLFLIMIFAYAAHDARLISRDIMWAWADVSGYLQLLIILAASLRGGNRIRLGMGNSDSCRHNHHLLPVSLWVSCEAISCDGSCGASSNSNSDAANSRPLVLSS